MLWASVAEYDKVRLVVPEDLVLDLLQDDRPFTVEELLLRVPELSWAQLFLAMDILSRRGDVELRRQGFTCTLKRVRGTGSGV